MLWSRGYTETDHFLAGKILLIRDMRRAEGLQRSRTLNTHCVFVLPPNHKSYHSAEATSAFGVAVVDVVAVASRTLVVVDALTLLQPNTTKGIS